MRTVLFFWAAVVVSTALSQTAHVGSAVRQYLAPPTPTPCIPTSPAAFNSVLKRRALARNVVMGRMETVLKSPPALPAPTSSVNSAIATIANSPPPSALPAPTSSVNSKLDATRTAIAESPPPSFSVPVSLPTISLSNEPTPASSPRRQTTVPTDDDKVTNGSKSYLPPLPVVAGLGGLAGLAAIISIAVTAICLVSRRKETPRPFDLNSGFQNRTGGSQRKTAARPAKQDHIESKKPKDLRMNTAKAIFFPTFYRKMFRSKHRLASLPVVSQPEEPIPGPFLKPQLENEDSWVTYMDHLYRRSQARFSLRAFAGTSSGNGVRRNGGEGNAASSGSRPQDTFTPQVTVPREPHIRSPIRGNFDELRSTSISGEREEIIEDGASENTATTILYRPNNDPWSSYNYGTKDTTSDSDRREDDIPRYGGHLWDSSNVGTIRNGQSSRVPGSNAPSNTSPVHNGLQGNFDPPSIQQSREAPTRNERERSAKNGNPFTTIQMNHAPTERETNRPSVFSLITTSSFDTESFVSMSDYNREHDPSFIPTTSRS